MTEPYYSSIGLDIPVLLERYKRGDFVKVIAGDLGCRPETVSKIAHWHGLPRRTNRDQTRHCRSVEIAQAYKDGMLLMDIVETFRCDKKTVYKVLRRFDIPKRRIAW